MTERETIFWQALEIADRRRTRRPSSSRPAATITGSRSGVEAAARRSLRKPGSFLERPAVRWIRRSTRGAGRVGRRPRHGHRPLQAAGADRRRRHGRRLRGRADPARAPQGGAEDHQARHGHRSRSIARFEAERQALAMMDHPNIAKVHDGGTTESGRPYFVMELVRGMPITEYCDQRAALDPRTAGAVRRSSARPCSTPIRRGSSTATSSPRTSW